ncbi:MAG: hypothetical protein HFI76_00710 [Lachnospiraceae bacterium]|nr:hypothetical protein [Lachnospiraceae bacterium]
MKKLRMYVFGIIASMLFTCLFLGVQVKASSPSQITGLKQTNSSTNSVSLEWNALLENNAYYQVDISQDGKRWVTKKEKEYANRTTIYSLNTGSSYYVRVRGFIQDKDEKFYGPYSATTECVTSPKGDTEYVRKIGSTTTSMKLNWKAVPGANAYIIKYRKASGSSNTEKSVRSTNTTVTLKKLSASATYHVTVYGVRKTKNGKYYTEASYSSSKSVYGLGVTPGKVTGVECDYFFQTLKQISVKYKKLPSAEGYKVEVWTANKKKDTKIATVSGSSLGADIAKSVFGKHNMIKIRVCAYTENYNGKKVYGKWSAWKYVCPQPDVTNIKKSGSGLTLTWDKISGANRYEVYASTKKNSGYKKVKTTTGTRFTLTSFNKKPLKKGKTYYFYVVAYKKVGSKYYSGEAGNAHYCWGKKFQ